MGIMACRAKMQKSCWEQMALYCSSFRRPAFMLLTGAVVLAAGCSTKFGVKEEVWKTLSEKQKEKVIEEYYKEKQQEREIEKKERQAQAAREERLLNSLDKDAYFPDRVLYGKLFGGRFRYDDDYYHFKPVYFSIAYGEIKPLRIELENGKCYTCYIEYGENKFLFDVSLTELDRDRAKTFPVNKKVRSGVHFSSFSTSNRSRLDGHGLHLNLKLKTDPPDDFSPENNVDLGEKR